MDIDVNEETENLLATTPDVGPVLKSLKERLEKLYVGIENIQAYFLTYENVQQLNLDASRNTLIMDLANIIRECESVRNQLLEILKRWQRTQALAILNEPLACHLDEIQCVVEILMDRIEDIKLLITNLQNFEYEPNLQHYLQYIQRLQNSLIASTFIVAEQPPQVKKKSTKFSANIRWLIGEKLNIYKRGLKVVCVVLSEAQVKHIDFENLLIPKIHHGRMTGNVCEMKYDSGNRHFSADFTNLTVISIDRSERRGSESVTEEKCALLFYTTLDMEYSIKCGAVTLPMVITVHDNQAPQAWATITWDNAFSSISREPFNVPERVHISNILNMLNRSFAHAAGRPLTSENLYFLRGKILSAANGLADDYVSFAQFAREKIPPERKFTFWEWFYGVMKLTRDYFKETWKSGHVVGFISKNDAKRKLSDKENGTFLIRFSDSVIGGITVAYRDFCSELRIISPWKCQDLQTRSLADRIRDVDLLRVVYPTRTPSSSAFHSFHNSTHAQRGSTRDGYDGTTELRVHITPQPNCDQQIQQQISKTDNSLHSLSTSDNDLEILNDIVNGLLLPSPSENNQPNHFSDNNDGQPYNDWIQ